jgi:uncharacterized protein YegL
MVSKPFKKVATLLSGLCMLSVLAGCSAERLKKLDQMLAPIEVKTAEFKGEFCTQNLNTPPGMKFYFVIDVTGSNQQTDPGRVKRTAGMRAMVEKFPNARFALHTFSGEVGVTVYQPFQDAEDFTTTLDAFISAANDQGGTPYTKTLQDVSKNIGDYLTQQLALPRAQRDLAGPIVIMYISDGQPTDGATVASVTELTKDILRKPIAMNALEIVNEVIANSGVYGTAVADPKELRAISEAGYGNFIDFNTGAIDFTKFRIPVDRSPTSESFGLFATNVNVLWEKDETGDVTLEPDTDGDGLSDRAEIKFQKAGQAPSGSEFIPDTDGNGVSDGIEAYYFKTPCAKMDCSKPSQSEDVRKPVTCDFIPDEEGGTTGHYAKDIVNNCEKIVSLANYKVFSTIGDKVPDGVKIRFGISPKDSTLGQADPQNDNMTTLQKVMFNLPWWFPNAQKAGFKPTKYITKFTGIKDNRSCYSFKIEDLPLKELSLKPGADANSVNFNHIRLWLTQSDRDLRDYLRVADVQLEIGKSVEVKDTDFK